MDTMKRVTSVGGKPGGLQDMINAVTDEDSPGASPQLLARIVDYINRSPDKGSDKAMKYLNNRFKQKHVKVQNLTLIVLETCMKRCGHMFREKLPFSDLWTELRKVATLKRKADVQIYNKILALIEDWSEAIELPAYRQELSDLRNKAVRFPARQARDLSEYKEGGTYNAYGQAQALPPGSSGALRGEYYGPGSPPPVGASPGASHSGTPYAHGGNGHFAPSPPKATPGNVASLPDNHLGAGQSAMKLRDDLFTAKNSADLLSEMLAGISIKDPADVKQDHVAELAGQCEAMLPRLAALAEQITDEANLQTTLTVHGDMEESLIKYHNLLEVAEGRTPSQLPPPSGSKLAGGLAGAAAKSAPVPPPPAKQASVSLLDFDDDPNAFGGGSSPGAASAAAHSAATLGAVAAASAPLGDTAPPAAAAAPPQAAPPAQPKPSPQDLLADLFDGPPAPAQGPHPGQGPPPQFGGGPPQFGGGPPQFGGGSPPFGGPPPFGGGPPQFGGGPPQFGGPPPQYTGGGPPQFGPGGPQQQQQQQPGGSTSWNGRVPSQGDTANPFGDFGTSSAGSPAGSQAGSTAAGASDAPQRAPSAGAQQGSSGSAPQGFGAFGEAPAAFGKGAPAASQAPPPFSQGFGGPRPPQFGQGPLALPSPQGAVGAPPSYGAPPQQQGGWPGGFSPQGPGPQGYGGGGQGPGPQGFGGGGSGFGETSAFGGGHSPYGHPPPFGGPPPFGAPPPYGAQGGFGPPPGAGGFGMQPPQFNSFLTPPPAHQHQQPQQPNFGQQPGQQPSQPKSQAFPSFNQQEQQQPKAVSPNSGNAEISSGLIPAVKAPGASSANPFDDPPVPAAAAPPAKAGSAVNSHPSGGAAPKPSWPPPDANDPFSDLGQLPPPIRR